MSNKCYYSIENISGCLHILGLFPGESKLVEDLTTDIKYLNSKNLIKISKTNKKVENKNKIINTSLLEEKKKKETTTVVNNIDDNVGELTTDVEN